MDDQLISFIGRAKSSQARFQNKDFQDTPNNENITQNVF